MGYDITPMWRLDARPMVDHLRAIFSHYRIDCVLDVGANRGQYRDLIRDHVGFRGLVVSFEPIPELARALVERAASDDRWVINDWALGARDTSAEFNIAASSELSSFLAPRRDAVAGFWQSEPITRAQTVPVRTVDAIFADLRERHGFSRPYLKLDTQGFDLEVLNGASRTLPGIVALQTELSVRPLYQGMPSAQEVAEHLLARNFSLTGLFPVVRDAHHRIVELDAVAVNQAYC